MFHLRHLLLSLQIFRSARLGTVGVHALLAGGEQSHVRHFLLSVQVFRSARLG